MAKSSIKGFLFGIIAAASYGLNPSLCLPLYSDGMNADSVLLLRYGLAVPMVALMMIIKGRSFNAGKGRLVPLAFLGIFMALSSLTLFCSYNYLAAGIASTILFVYPIMVAVIMTLFFNEKTGIKTVVCIALATFGILLLYRNGEGETISLVGTLLAIGSALSYALYLVGVSDRKIAGIDSMTMTFYILCFGFVLFALRLAFGGELTLPTKWYLWLDAIALAALPTVVSLICTTAAIQIIGSTSTALLGAIEPVTAVTMGIIFFDEGMTGREAIGIVLIVISVSLVIYKGASK